MLLVSLTRLAQLNNRQRAIGLSGRILVITPSDTLFSMLV
jgi:hypothetical protein